MQSETAENTGGELPSAVPEGDATANELQPQPQVQSKEEREEMESLRQASAADPGAFASEKDKKEFIEMCGRLEKRRDYWQDTMFQLFAQEEAEDKRTKALLREAYVNEASYALDEDFQKWRMEQNAKARTIQAASTSGPASAASLPSHAAVASSVATNCISNSERLQRWYDNDELLGLTPFAAVVPFPRRISERGLAQVMATIDSTMTGKEGFVVEAFLLHPPLETDDPTSLAEDQGRASAGSTRTTIPKADTLDPLHSGADALARLETDPVLAAALDQTPCLFLNDIPTFVSQESRTIGSALVVVLGGKLVAIECFLRHPSGKTTAETSSVNSGATSSHHTSKWSSRSTEPERQHSAASVADKYGPSIKTALTAFVEKGGTGLVSLLQCSNFTALLRMMPPKEMSEAGRPAAPAAVEISLLGVAPLEVRDYELFTWVELKEAAESGQLKERNRNKQDAQERRRREIEDGLRPKAEGSDAASTTDGTEGQTQGSTLPLIRFTWDWDQLPEPSAEAVGAPPESSSLEQPGGATHSWESANPTPGGKSVETADQKVVHKDTEMQLGKEETAAGPTPPKPAALSAVAIAALSAVGASLVTGVVVTGLLLRKGTR